VPAKRRALDGAGPAAPVRESVCRCCRRTEYLQEYTEYLQQYTEYLQQYLEYTQVRPTVLYKYCECVRRMLAVQHGSTAGSAAGSTVLYCDDVVLVPLVLAVLGGVLLSPGSTLSGGM